MDILKVQQAVQKDDREGFLRRISGASDEELEQIQLALELLRVELEGKLRALGPLIHRAELAKDDKRLDKMLEKLSRLETARGWTRWKEVALSYERNRRQGRTPQALAQALEAYLLQHAQRR